MNIIYILFLYPYDVISFACNSLIQQAMKMFAMMLSYLLLFTANKFLFILYDKNITLVSYFHLVILFFLMHFGNCVPLLDNLTLERFYYIKINRKTCTWRKTKSLATTLTGAHCQYPKID